MYQTVVCGMPSHKMHQKYSGLVPQKLQEVASDLMICCQAEQSLPTKC